MATFRPLSEAPFGMPQPPTPDPPGYYGGWPLAGVVKRLGAAAIDYPVLWFGLIMAVSFVSNVVAAVSTEGAGSAAGAWAVFVAWAIIVWNGDFRQGRSGQSFGKQIMGLRTVDMANLGTPGRVSCMSRSLGLLFDVGLFGVGILLIAFSDKRRSFGDRFGGTVVLDERRAGATIAWAVPGERADELAAPEPQCAVHGYKPPSAWRRWKEGLSETEEDGPPPDAGQPDATQPRTVVDPNGGGHYAWSDSHTEPALPEPALPGLDDDEPDQGEGDAPPISGEVPVPRTPFDAELPPLGAGGMQLPVEVDEIAGDDEIAEDDELSEDDKIAEGRRVLLDVRLAFLARDKGLPEPRRFVTEEIVGAVEAGDLDEAFLYAGREARAYVRAFQRPRLRHSMVRELTEDFHRLVRIFGEGDLGEGLEAARIRRRLGLQSVWESTGGDDAEPPASEARSVSRAHLVPSAHWVPPDDSYFAGAAAEIEESLAAGEADHADELARKTITALFAAGEPVSVEAALADYRDLLSHCGGPVPGSDAGTGRDLDDASLQRRLGLLTPAS
jgi:uncharacterized RDD family membrane protein YckC